MLFVTFLPQYSQITILAFLPKLGFLLPNFAFLVALKSLIFNVLVVEPSKNSRSKLGC